MALVGSFVSIFGLQDAGVQGKCLQLPQMFVEDEELEEVQIDGKTGVCIDWRDDLNKYLVKTFDNIVAYVAEENLQEYFPGDALSGGFDFAWPAEGEVPMVLGEGVAERLWQNGFCVLQMFIGDEDRKVMADEAEDVPKQYRMKREIEAAYLGIDSNTKVSLRKMDTPKVEVKDAMTSADRSLTALTRLLYELPATSLGLNSPIKHRTNAMLRTSYKDSNEAEELTPESLYIIPDSDDWQGDLRGWANFVCERSMCMLYMIENQGGDIWLYPNDAKNFASVRIPISPGKMLIFRHDYFDYSYQPVGRSLALQSWIMKDRSQLKAIQEMEIDWDEKKARLNPGFPMPPSDPAYVQSLSVNVPQNTTSEGQCWTLWASGNDTCTQWPVVRWETDPYYMPGEDAVANGKAYTCHGGFMEDKQFNNFDNIFFGISSEESAVMFNGQRISLETGYTCLAKAGYNRYTLVNQPIGCWVGDSGQDWHSFMDIWPAIFPTWPTEMIAPSMHVSVTALRLSFVFNLKGPASSYDTACSASLIALNAAHKHMTAEEAGRGHRQALVWGANTLLGPVSYISNCAGNMLTHRGRCFTFTSSADGYQRGEGVSSFFVKMDSSEEEIKNRLSTIVGTASAHGGRSASITAPNGPAQTMLIAKSMKFAGFDTADVSVGEMHGTGTSLGDPIEVGSYQAVFKKGRNFPVYMSTQKTNFGHMECNAGATGLVKCICLSRVFCTPPNCHFNDLNPNISTIEDGFPVFFTSEICDCATSAGYVGVSSFGFGGAYSRCDLYTEAHRGPNKMRNLDLPRPALPVYSFDPKFEQVCIIGSWSQMQIADEMQHQGDGVFTYLIKLSDACVERFRLMLGQTDDRVIYPGIKKATADAQVLGPDNQCADRFWVLDGRQDGMPSGAVYQITFEWNAQAKRVWWEPVTVSGPLGGSLALEMPTLHEYFITGSISEDRIVEMKKVADDDGTYHQAVFEMGPRGQAEFQILMDKDPDQTFCLDPSAKTIVGPDVSAGTGKFRVEGKLFDLVTIKFRIADGISSITVTTPSGKLQWGSLPDVTMPDA
mmetsp:Transcript_40061/g.73204  ORF Transcript_40061/g.73204 Transcript_40061/m.73204 type:complete len:1057 (-) Transcript_40061:43-3213(-)